MNKRIMPVLFLFLLCQCFAAFGQSEVAEEDRSYKPLTLSLNDEGNKYIRFITWHQIWAEDGNLNNDTDPQGFSMRLRRSRMLTYAQISSRFLILTHFGLNTLTGANADPIGNTASNRPTLNAPQIFMHGAWTEFRVLGGDELFIGAGLHYWNGLSRFTSASTLNFMTLDNYRQAWASLGLSDQFARHLGVYAKGKLGKLRYTMAVNEPIVNGLGASASPSVGTVSYSGRAVANAGTTNAVAPTDAGLILAGYFDYQFFDQESNKLPYRVGSYLGKKTVFNVGAGFFSHAQGTITSDDTGILTSNNVGHFALDVFYDAPLGKGAVNAYAAYYNFNYGDNFNLGTTYGTGSSFYTQLGYLLPEFTTAGRLMPYVTFSNQNFEAFQEAGNNVNLGVNWFINGHNAKITLQYQSSLSNYSGPQPDRVNGAVLQTHIFL